VSRVRFNIAANIAGQAWAILLGIACTPFYIKLLGIEAYGLIAFYLVLQSICQLFDFGLGATVSREVARSSGSPEGAEKSSLALLVGTLEKWYWLLGLVLGIVLFFAVPMIAGAWLKPEKLSQSDLAESAKIFGLLALLQWPASFYQNGLVGLQRQVLLNFIQIPFSALASIGGLIFIWLGPRSVAALLSWQAGVLVCQIGLLYVHFWRQIGIQRSKATASMGVLLAHWRFSLGMSGISVTGLVITHLDKLVLSRLLPLEVFGHYSLAGALARGLYVLISPIFSAYFPRLTALVAKREANEVRVCYHTATQVVAVLVLPLAAVVGCFSEEIARIWLHDRELAAQVAPLASLLVLGTCLNGLMNIPFALQLAHGRTAIGLVINLCLLVFLVPSIIYATSHFGARGGAAMWAVANALYLAVGLPVTHGYLLGGEIKEWLLGDILSPLLIAISVVGLGRLLMPAGMGIFATVAFVGIIWACATLLAGLSSRRMRHLGFSVLAARPPA
jgi:O-antigen/teichoic acid export membrane protein